MLYFWQIPFYSFEKDFDKMVDGEMMNCVIGIIWIIILETKKCDTRFKMMECQEVNLFTFGILNYVI